MGPRRLRAAGFFYIIFGGISPLFLCRGGTLGRPPCLLLIGVFRRPVLFQPSPLGEGGWPLGQTDEGAMIEFLRLSWGCFRRPGGDLLCPWQQSRQNAVGDGSDGHFVPIVAHPAPSVASRHLPLTGGVGPGPHFMGAPIRQTFPSTQRRGWLSRHAIPRLSLPLAWW